MKNTLKHLILTVLFWNISFSVKAEVVYEGPASGETLTITAEDTYVDSTTQGILNNYGEAQLQDHFVDGIFNNYGNVFSNDAFSISGGPGNESNRRIINHSTGNMVVTGYMDFYSYDSLFENAGRFSAIDTLGDGTLNYFGEHISEPFTLLLRGVIKNTGSFLINKRFAPNACKAGTGVIYNSGTFEISQGTNCNFAEHPKEDLRGKTSYIQNDGELKVNGYFATHDTRINGGVITGAGTIEGLDYRLFNKVSLSPGSPIGALSITPNRPYLYCANCSIDIELAGNEKYDKLQVNGNFYLYRWKLNILLRDGYIPQLGDNFDIVSADYLEILGPSPSYNNLPELPFGLNWDVQNDGTKITLTVI